VAISKTNNGGEVVVLSTAGYGPFTVNKSVSVICPPAYHAAMAPTTGNAITVNASGATVIVRNLYLNSLGADNGVWITSDTVVHIESLVVNGFNGSGIADVHSGGTAEIFVKDSEIRGNGSSGIYLGPASGNATVSIDHVRLERNNYGLAADSGVDLTVRDTVAAHNLAENFWFRSAGSLSPLRASVERSIAADTLSALSGGFVAENGAKVTIRDSASVRNSFGFRSHGGSAGSVMTIDRCLAAENDSGFLADNAGAGQGVMVVSNSTATRNTSYGIVAGVSGFMQVFGNTVTFNGTGLCNCALSTFRSGGNNFVDGNNTQTSGTITPVPTM
jgi:hypothetical protein